jgi:hypothetical protein
MAELRFGRPSTGSNGHSAGRLPPMKILYKPFAIVAGVMAARVGRKTFKQIWGKIDEQDPPDPSTQDAPLGKVVAAAALEAATMAAVAAAASRVSAQAFHYLFGIWPGKKEPEQLPEHTD